MAFVAPRRRAFSTLTALTVAAALAGCGGDDTSTGGAGGDSGDSEASEAQTLLKDGFLRISKDGEPITSGAFAIKLSGKVDAPQDDEIRGIDGSISLSGAVDKVKEGQELPPFTMKFDVDGTYTDAKGKANDGKYNGAVSFIDDAFFANWDGKDYAVGAELSKTLLDEIEKEAGKTGAKAGSASGSTPGLYGGVDPQKVLDAMELDPGTWFKDPKVEDGGELDGVKTKKVSGPVDPKIVADDVTEGLRNLPKAMPDLPGVQELADISDASDADLAELEKGITKLDAAVWVGEEDHLQRKMTLDVAVDTKEDGEPIKAELSLEATSSKLNQPQSIAAPASPEPITDLFLILEKEFSGLFPTSPTANGTRIS